MNWNLLGYAIYALVTAFIIGYVGRRFFVNGAPYLYDLFGSDRATANSLNVLLLVAYYLFNLGYVALSLSQWPAIQNAKRCVDELAERIGIIVLALAFMHYLNLFWLSLASRKMKSLKTK